MLYLGVVTKVEDPKKFVIRATIEGYIEDVIAYPIDTFDELNPGDPILMWQIETIYGYSFVYHKQRLYDHTRMKIGDCVIDIDGNGDSAEPGTITIKNADSTVVVKNGGHIEIKAATDCTVEAPQVTITGGKCTIKGTVPPTGKGALCGIPNCLFTGAPHSGDTANET